ncbi:MAG: M28 family peptidase [Dehalococcoidia bacterium]|nr:M28 family peptidase [Dehalococcoidia bacterium]
MTTQLLAAIALAAVLAAACSGGGSEDASPTPAAPAPTTTVTPTDAEATPTKPATPAAALPEIGERLDHDLENAMEHVRVLSVAIGARVSGSQEARETVAYIAEALRSYGYAVEVTEFTYETRFRQATVTVGGETIEGVALNGEATSAKSAEGRAVDGGLTGNDSFSGAIPVGSRSTSRPQDAMMYMAAARNGAAGLVIVNHEPWRLAGFPIPARDAIPVVLVAHTEAERFSRAIAEGASISIDIGPARPVAMNVIARPGEDARCDILAGGHHDTVSASPGAVDNASGVAIILELARAFAADGLDEGLCFVTFGAEESGLFGSRALARSLAENGELPEVMVNFDVTARGDAIEVIGTRALVERTVALLEREGFPAYASALPEGYGSDHSSFADVGVPVLFFSDGDVSLIHTPADVIDLVEPEALDRIGDGAAFMLGILLGEIAGGP